MSRHIIEVNIFVAPFEIMNYSLVRQLFLYYKDILKEINDSFFDVKMIEFSNHCFLIFKITFVLVDQSISFIDDISDIVKDGTICAFVKKI